MPKIILILLLLIPGLAVAAPLSERDGWMVMPTAKSHAELLGDLRAAVKANKFGLVTQAGPTKAAASRGITIPGNVVVGVFRNDYAVRILGLSTAAMIEAPIRFYVTENEDGTATLSWKTPSFVFAPYMQEGGADLKAAAAELDATFLKIGEEASR